MTQHKIDTEGLDFEVIMADVEALNQQAFAADLDITKLSYHAYAHLSNSYILLDSGSALGNNCGPLLIAQKDLTATELQKASIAIPGKYTTANFLFSLAYPSATQKKELLFSEIENAVLDGTVDAGVIIHENRFTYAEKGLVKLQDLGEYWESNYKMPIPLGGIVVKRHLAHELQLKINRVLNRSIQYAFEHTEETLDYVSQYAQEMDRKVMLQHISLYVNKYTLDLGTVGKQAIQKMYSVGNELGILQKQNNKIFTTE